MHAGGDYPCIGDSGNPVNEESLFDNTFIWIFAKTGPSKQPSFSGRRLESESLD
jgi:hypothetical protein